jgi:translation initiation factor 1
MGKKKLSSFSDLSAAFNSNSDGFVFSTNEKEDFSQYKDQKNQTVENNEQYLEAHFSNKSRGGKTVTVIKGYVGNESNLKALGKLLKQKCGVGGSVKNGEIIIQGNFRDKIIEILKKENYNVKRVGG